MYDDFCTDISELANISKFHAVCLFYEYAEDEECHDIELDKFIDEVI